MDGNKVLRWVRAPTFAHDAKLAPWENYVQLLVAAYLLIEFIVADKELSNDHCRSKLMIDRRRKKSEPHFFRVESTT